MNAKQILPEGANWLTPYLTVADAAASLDFYQRAFGFEPAEVLRDSHDKVVHAGMLYQGKSIVMFAPEGGWGNTSRTPAHSGSAPPIGLYVYCADADAMLARAQDVGAAITMAAEDMFWGDRVGQLRDPDGYLWSFATRVGEFDPSKMPKL